MTEECKTGFYKPDHTKYSGELSLFDFEGHHTMGTMTQKIVSAENFNKMCKKNVELRDRAKKQRGAYENRI
jgi:hypothetical protein